MAVVPPLHIVLTVRHFLNASAASKTVTSPIRNQSATCRSSNVKIIAALKANIIMAHWTEFEKETEKETKKLIRRISGIEDEDDQNFQLAVKFAWSNFR